MESVNEKLEVLFPEGDDTGSFIVLRLAPVHRFLASRIEETALQNLCSNLPLWKRTVVCIIAPDLCVPGEVQVISQASTANV